jgi:beta-1,2-mannobiose phosphorylase / 1,2-beta-oligomannan phosphorylase
MHPSPRATVTEPTATRRASKQKALECEPLAYTSSVRLSPKAQRISQEPIIAFGSVSGYGAVFNAGVIEHNGIYHLFARGIREGYRRNQGDGARFLDYVSDVLVFTSSDGIEYRFQQVLARSSDEWIHAVEDPRVQWVTSGGSAHAVMTYTNLPHPSTGAPWRVGAHRLTFDGQQFALDHQSGCVLGAEGVHDKDAVVFNLRSGKVALIHRVHPNIQVAVFDDLDHLWSADETYWDAHMRDLDQHTIIASSVRVSGVGAGAPPVATDDGLLLFYHERLTSGTYTMNVALLDHDTGRVLAVLPEPVLVPELPWELLGDVDDVVFVGGAVARPDGTIYLTYGAADRCVGAAVMVTAELLAALREVAVPAGMVG